VESTGIKQSILVALSVFLLALLFVTPSYAVPSQRIIISFNTPVTDTHKTEIMQNLNALLSNGYSIAEHSDSTRWIVILTLPLDQQKFIQVQNSLLKNSFVQYVEMDKLQMQKTIIKVQ